MTLSTRVACVQVAISAAVPGRLARTRRLRVVTLGLTGILLPQYQNKVDTYCQPAFFGEIAFMLWLVIKGAKPQALAAGASSSTAA